MNIDQKFYIWCTRKCLHLWHPPMEVIIWLKDPENIEKAQAASRAAWEASAEEESTGATWIGGAAGASGAAGGAAWAMTSVPPEETGDVVGWIIVWTAKSLDTTVDAVKHEFVSTLTDEELSITDSKWVEYITAEIFTR